MVVWRVVVCVWVKGWVDEGLELEGCFVCCVGRPGFCGCVFLIRREDGRVEWRIIITTVFNVRYESSDCCSCRRDEYLEPGWLFCWLREQAGL